MCIRSAEWGNPLALPTRWFCGGYPALPRADHRAPEVAPPLSGAMAALAPSRKRSSLHRAVRTRDHHFRGKKEPGLLEEPRPVNRVILDGPVGNQPIDSQQYHRSNNSSNDGEYPPPTASAAANT